MKRISWPSIWNTIDKRWEKKMSEKNHPQKENSEEIWMTKFTVFSHGICVCDVCACAFVCVRYSNSCLLEDLDNRAWKALISHLPSLLCFSTSPPYNMVSAFSFPFLIELKSFWTDYFKTLSITSFLIWLHHVPKHILSSFFCYLHPL